MSSSKLSVGIVGLPNVGKSTLFNALAQRRLAETAARPFTTIDPHEAVVAVQDDDLVKLSKLVNPDDTVSATVTFVDIAGLVKGANEGEGLGNQFLAKIREVDAIIHVVRAFYDPQVVHTDSDFEPGSLEQIMDDIEIINIELELGEIQKRPTIIVLNVGEDDINSDETKGKIIAVTEKFKVDTMAVSAKIEEELIDFNESDKKEYLSQLGIQETGLERLIGIAYRMLDLITFYTVKGGSEVHAWSIERGSSVLTAAEKVHTDFAQGFIMSEVINVTELLDSGGWKSAKEKGKIRFEGKDYLVQDNDVIEFKYNT